MRSQGYLSLLSPFTHTLSLIMILAISPYNSLNLESQNQSKNIPVAIPGSLINIWGISVKGFLRYDRDKQSVRQTNICKSHNKLLLK